MDENKPLSEVKKTQLVPFIGLKEGVIFPDTDAVLTFGRPSSVASVNEAHSNNQEVCFVSQRDPKSNAASSTDYYTVGTVCRIVKTLPVNDELHAIVRGLFRVFIKEVVQRDGQMWAVVETLEDDQSTSSTLIALSNRATALIKRVTVLGKTNIVPGVLNKL